MLKKKMGELAVLSTQDMAWIGFNLFVLIMLALDLGVFHRKSHTVSIKEAIFWSAVWIALALIFGAGIYHWRGSEAGTAFLTGYLIEKSLSIDNVFVFLTIFSFFKTPSKYQHKVLFWGVLGALLMRAGFIFAGIALIQKFHWVIYVFGAFLIYTAFKMVKHHGQEVDPANSLVIRLARRFLPVSVSSNDGRFWVREAGKLAVTPLFLTLVVVEISDLIFAVDSIPAILAITDDSFIVYTSNVFAIMGLRSLYFALAGAVSVFAYLHYGLAAVLAFVGTKMLIADFYKIPVSWALAIVAVLLLISVVVSVVAQKSVSKNGGDTA